MPSWSTCLVFRLASIKLLFLKNQSFLSSWRSVRIKEHAIPRSRPLAFIITTITSLRKKFPSPYPSLPWIERFSIRLWLSLFIGRISCPTFAENNILHFVFWVAGKGSGIGRLKRQGGSGHEMWKKAQSESPFCLEEVKGKIPHLCLNWGLENRPRNLWSPWCLVLTFIRTNGRNATTRNDGKNNCQQHESKRGLHDGVIRLNNIQNLKDNTK